MAFVKVYGKVYDRFEEAIFKESVDEALIDKAIELAKTATDEEKDEWMDTVIEPMDIPYVINVLISGILTGDMYEEGANERIEASWKENKSFNIWMEELLFGVAPTGKDAKLQYLKLEDDSEEEWD